MRIRLASILLLFLPSFLIGQLTLEQATLGQWRQFRPKDLNNIQWKNERTVTCWDISGIQQLSPNGEKTMLYSLSQLNAVLKDSLKGFPFSYSWSNPSTLHVQQGLRIIQLNVETGTLLRDYTLPEDAENIHPHLPTGKTAFTRGQNVWLAGSDGGLRALSFDEAPGIVNGSGYVHRQEFGISEGLFWSPDGQSLAWYRKDEGMVTEYPLVESPARIANHRPVRYPMAGMKSEEVTLQVLKLNGGQIQTLRTPGDKEQYLAAVTWSPDNNADKPEPWKIRAMGCRLLHVDEPKHGKPLDGSLFKLIRGGGKVSGRDLKKPQAAGGMRPYAVVELRAALPRCACVMCARKPRSTIGYWLCWPHSCAAQLCAMYAPCTHMLAYMYVCSMRASACAPWPNGGNALSTARSLHPRLRVCVPTAR